MIDTHAHLYAAEFNQDRDEIIQIALKHHINKILQPNINLDSIQPMLDVEAAYPQTCYSMIGLHPCYIDHTIHHALTIMESWFDKHNFIAVGEIGIDLYWDKTFQSEQEVAFVTQLKWAKEHQLPVVIHTRDSIKETMKLVAQEQDGSLRGVFHCFGGTLEEAKAINDLGFHLGIGGVSTFKNGGMDAVIPHLNLNYVLLETDCPYLAPTPHRGKRNEPAYIEIIAHRIAELTHTSFEHIQQITDENAKGLFNL